MNNNLSLMQKRIRFSGGETPQDRIIQGKKDGFESALISGANSQTISINNKEYRVLINDNKLTQNYDEKIISAPLEVQLKTGDIVYWLETDSYWIVFLEDISELAYTTAYMRKCHTEPIISTNVGAFKKHPIRVAAFGNEDNLIQSTIKTNVVIDSSKLTLQLLISNTSVNNNIFKRYNKFVLGGITWEIQAVNAIDLNGVLIVYAQEDISFIEDNPIENKDTTSGSIIGKLIIKPLETATYTVSDDTPISKWAVDNKNISIVDIKDREIIIKWTSVKSGEFLLGYGDHVQKIIVESLF
jgi:hypothetical protein